jgi:hypothetical protein
LPQPLQLLVQPRYLLIPALQQSFKILNLFILLHYLLLVVEVKLLYDLLVIADIGIEDPNSVDVLDRPGKMGILFVLFLLHEFAVGDYQVPWENNLGTHLFYFIRLQFG